IQTQIEKIFTERVMNSVIDKAGLLPLPPSQSMLAKLTKKNTIPTGLDSPDDRARLIMALKTTCIRVDAINSVVMGISAQMNTPELAQKVSRATYEAYREEFQRQQEQDQQFDKFFVQRLKAIEEMIAGVEKEMVEFNKAHPREMPGGKDPLLLPVP